MLSDETIEEAKTELPALVTMVPAESTVWVHEPANVLLQHAQHRATDADLRDVLKALPPERLAAVLEPWLYPGNVIIDGNVTFNVPSIEERGAKLKAMISAGARLCMGLFVATIPPTPLTVKVNGELPKVIA